MFLDTIFKAIVLNKILYVEPPVEASPLLGYYDLNMLAENAQYKLFRHS